MNYCMVRNKYLTFLGAGLLFMASACNDGYEKEPVEQFTLDYLFPELIRLVYNPDDF